MIYDSIKIEKLSIKKISDKSFDKFGKVLSGFDFSELENYMHIFTSVPKDGNMYLPSVEEMEQTMLNDEIKYWVYGGMDIQIGLCNGNNSNLNALEYHKGSEINYAVTEFVLMLGLTTDINDNTYHTDKIEAFFIPQGTAIEIYQTTLHFAPCKVSKFGFKCIVILPKGTNTPLEKDINPVCHQNNENQLLFMKNKWLLAHPDNRNLISKGAFVGIEGVNHKVIF
jgi:hypothetical protein